MKKNSWLFGLVVCILAFGFLFTGCDSSSDGGGGGGGGSSSGSAELSFSNEQVYTVGEDWDNLYIPYTGSMQVTSNLGVSGSITSGKFSFAIGEPANLKGLDFTDLFPGASMSPVDVQGAIITFNNESLVKSDGGMSGSNITQEEVFYCYVDRSCTIAIPAMTQDGITFLATTLKLGEGWNAINQKISGSMTTMTGTAEFKIVDFSYGKWVIVN